MLLGGPPPGRGGHPRADRPHPSSPRISAHRDAQTMSRLAAPPPGPAGPAPASDERLLRLKKELHQKLISELDLSALGSLSEEELRQEVRRGAEQLCRQSSDLLSLSEREKLVGEVLDETFGIGPLEPLMRDPTVSDILVNGPKMRVRRAQGAGSRGPTWSSTTRSTCIEIVQRIVGRVGRRIDETSPLVRRPHARRLASQRRHPAAGAGRHACCRSAASQQVAPAVKDLVEKQGDHPGDGRLPRRPASRPG